MALVVEVVKEGGGKACLPLELYGDDERVQSFGVCFHELVVLQLFELRYDLIPCYESFECGILANILPIRFQSA